MKMLQGNVLVTEVEKETLQQVVSFLPDASKLDKAINGLVLSISVKLQRSALFNQDQVYLTCLNTAVNVDGKKAIIHYKHIKAL